MKNVIAITLASLLHIALFMSPILRLFVARTSRSSETVYEIAMINNGFHYETKTQSTNPLTAEALCLGGEGIRVGAFKIYPGQIQGNAESSEPKINELGFGGSVAGGHGGSWANSIVSIRLNRITRDLHDWIDSSLYYPRTVEAILSFDSNGNFVRGQSHFKSNSNYLRTWLIRHLKRLFTHPLSFPIGDKSLRVSAFFEFTQGAPLVYGSFKNTREERDRKRAFQSAGSPRREQKGVFGGRLFFQRNSFKNYGLAMAIEDGSPIPTPVLDVLGLVDRLARVLDISADKRRENDALLFLRDDPEWTGN